MSPGIHPHWLPRVHGNAVYAHPAPNACTNRRTDTGTHRVPNDVAERCSICSTDGISDCFTNNIADNIADHLAD
jgi:hypothetical protein